MFVSKLLLIICGSEINQNQNQNQNHDKKGGKTPWCKPKIKMISGDFWLFDLSWYKNLIIQSILNDSLALVGNVLCSCKRIKKMINVG